MNVIRLYLSYSVGSDIVFTSPHGTKFERKQEIIPAFHVCLVLSLNTYMLWEKNYFIPIFASFKAAITIEC